VGVAVQDQKKHKSARGERRCGNFRLGEGARLGGKKEKKEEMKRERSKESGQPEECPPRPVEG